jgi:hypothetical protein
MYRLALITTLLIVLLANKCKDPVPELMSSADISIDPNPIIVRKQRAIFEFNVDIPPHKLLEMCDSVGFHFFIPTESESTTLGLSYEEVTQDRVTHSGVHRIDLKVERDSLPVYLECELFSKKGTRTSPSVLVGMLVKEN